MVELLALALLGYIVYRDHKSAPAPAQATPVDTGPTMTTQPTGPTIALGEATKVAVKPPASPLGLFAQAQKAVTSIPPPPAPDTGKLWDVLPAQSILKPVNVASVGVPPAQAVLARPVFYKPPEVPPDASVGDAEGKYQTGPIISRGKYEEL